jgi:1-acyl-sn-glycerol-3-phosphate acyltransferase
MTAHPDPLSEGLSAERAVRRIAGGESSTDAGPAARDAPRGRARADREVVRTPLAPGALRPTLAGRLLFYWSFFVAGLLLLVFGPPTILVAWLARRREWVYPLALWGGRQWLRLSGMRVVVRGRENLRPGRTYIIVSNHRSYLDTATLFCHLGRRIGLFAKKELLKVPILGYGMGYVNILAIDRSNRERAIRTVGEATERIRSGIPFGVFAEGTRARPGELLPFKKGAFYMAVETRVPIIPVAMKHTDVLMGKGTGFARPGTIEMVLLPPVPVEDLPADRDEAVAHLIRETRARIAAELLAA